MEKTAYQFQLEYLKELERVNFQKEGNKILLCNNINKDIYYNEIVELYMKLDMQSIY